MLVVFSFVECFLLIYSYLYVLEQYFKLHLAKILKKFKHFITIIILFTKFNFKQIYFPSS